MKRSIIKTPNDFRGWMSNCRDVWAFDCETTSLDYLDLEMIGFSIADGRQACYVPLTRIHKKEILCILDYYIQEARIIIFHSAPFDMMVLHKEGIEV